MSKLAAEARSTGAERSVPVLLLRPHPKQGDFVNCKTKRVMVRAGRRGGKTTGVAIRCVMRFLKGRRQLYAAPTSDQVSRFWTEVTRALGPAIEAGVFIKNESQKFIERAGTEQRIKAKTAWNADSLRGDYADDLTLDEFQLMDENTWDDVGAPMLLDNNGDAVFIYTPPSLNSKSTSKARDPRHAAKRFERAKADPRYQTFHFTSHDNPHISAAGLEEIVQDMSALSYRQEIMAEDVDEAPGALWKRSTLDELRVSLVPEDLIRIGVGVDPSGGATECGTVVAGIANCKCKGFDEVHGFVLTDATPEGVVSPDFWGSNAVDVYTEWDADRIFAESNFGGDMVESTIKTADRDARVELVNASRGKAVRAEPVSALYEQGKVHHVGRFTELEDEQCEWSPASGARSPNRMDALVWVLTKLMLNRKRGFECA